VCLAPVCVWHLIPMLVSGTGAGISGTCPRRRCLAPVCASLAPDSDAGVWHWWCVCLAPDPDAGVWHRRGCWCLALVVCVWHPTPTRVSGTDAATGVWHWWCVCLAPDSDAGVWHWWCVCLAPDSDAGV
jgi:hypothetical protein